MKKTLIGFIALMVMILMASGQVLAVQASGEMMSGAKEEAMAKAFIDGVTSSGQNSAVFLEKHEIAPEMVTEVLTNYFQDIGLDERYTSYQVSNSEEAKILAPVLDKAVFFALVKKVHNDHGCRKETNVDTKKIANLDANFAMIKKLDKNSMLKGEGASYLGEALAFRSYKWSKEMREGEVIKINSRKDLERLTHSDSPHSAPLTAR